METNESYNIKVTNKRTNMTYDHKSVPFEYVKLLINQPNLDVEIISTCKSEHENVTTTTSS